MIIAGHRHAAALPRRADQHRPLPVRPRTTRRQLVGVLRDGGRQGACTRWATPQRRASRRPSSCCQHRRDPRLPGARRLLQAPAHRPRADQRAHQARAEGARPAGHDTPDIESPDGGGGPGLGVGKIEDFTWKGMLDFATCTECGRCQSQCPAWNTDKPLSPKLADHGPARPPVRQGAVPAGRRRRRRGQSKRTPGVERGPARTRTRQPRRARVRLRPGRRTSGPAQDERPLVGDRRVGRRHRPGRAVVLHHLRRLRRAVPGRHRARRPHRRHAPLPGADRVGVPERGRRDAAQPREQGQPVGRHPASRTEWIEGLPFEVQVVDAGDAMPDDVEYLFWVGCAGAIEDRSQEGHPRVRRTAAHRRRRVRRPRHRRVLHR